MPRRTSLTAVLATAMLTVGLSSTAHASTASVQKQVSAHLKSAQSSAKAVTRLTKKGDATGARRALKSARHEAVAAARGARQLAANADDSNAAAQSAIWSLTAAAGTYGDAMKRFSSLIPSAGDITGLQSALAGALPGTVAGHEQLITELTSLVNELSGSAQALAAQALAAVQAAAPAQVQQIASIAGLSDLPTQISTIVQQALSTATTALNTGLSTLTSLMPQLPDGVEAQVTTALTSITATVQQLLPLIQQVLGVATDAATTGIKAATGCLNGMLNGVLGDFLSMVPGLSAITGGTQSSTSTPATTTGSTQSSGGLGGLIGGLINIPMSLPKGILGGLSGLLGGGLLR